MEYEYVKRLTHRAGIHKGKVELLGISVVKNESDIIESFVRYNLNFLDALLIIDNGSADTTASILQHLEQEKLPLACFSDDQPGHFQSRRLEKLGNLATEIVSPRYIVPLDADEFIVSDGSEHLRRELRALPPGTAGRVAWKTYVPTVQDDLEERDPLRRITHRRIQDNHWCSKVIAPSAMFRDRSVTLMEGNHGMASDAEQIEHVALSGIRLAHFPIRSEQQLLSKILCGWLGMQLNHQRQKGGAFHWEMMYQKLKEKGSFSRIEIQELGSRYSDIACQDLTVDPLRLPPDYSIRFGEMTSVRPMTNFLCFLENVASRYSLESLCSERQFSELSLLDSPTTADTEGILLELLHDVEHRIKTQVILMAER